MEKKKGNPIIGGKKMEVALSKGIVEPKNIQEQGRIYTCDGKHSVEGTSCTCCWVALRHRAKLHVDHSQTDYFSSVMFSQSYAQMHRLRPDIVDSLSLEVCKHQLATHRASEVV